MDEIEDAFKVRGMLSDTLGDFDFVATPGTGAILFSKRWARTELPRNLHAAVVATLLGLSSLDYARRKYTHDEPEQFVSPTDLFVAATQFATEYREDARERVTHADVGLGMGAHAARVALQRLESGFDAADLLYRLGFNFEGDAVARQILEQVAWSLVVAEVDDIAAIGKVKAESSVGALKRVIPSMGRLYGELSATTHASLAQHREAFRSPPDGQNQVVLAWSRLAPSARVLLMLADAWVVVWEKSQRAMMTSFSAFATRDTEEPLVPRQFLVDAQTLIDAIHDEETQEGTGDEFS